MSDRAGFGPALALTAALALASFLILMAVAVKLSHPHPVSALVLAGRVNQQNQGTKTALYLAALAVILPAAIFAAPRIADAIAAANPAGLAFLSAATCGGLAAILILVRISSSLPWGDGLNALLGAVILWALAAGAALLRAGRGAWPTLLALSGWAGSAAVAAGVAVFGVLLCVASLHALHPLALGLGMLVIAAALALSRTAPGIRALSGSSALDWLFVLLLAVAIPNVVIFHSTGHIPNVYLPPGVIQNQQDYLLGSANQLIHGGALLVGVPVSQYGVGLVYFLGGWFHLVPIGYGTLGLLDSLLTALFYIAGFLLLRVARVSRPVAVAAVCVGVLALLYGLHYPVGDLPETGPLRFGLPMCVVLARVLAARSPRRAAVWRALSLCAVGIAAIWAVEAFFYTAAVFVVLVCTEAWLAPAGRRRRFISRELLLALAACVAAHVLLALATLAGSGQLPDWGPYLDYVHSFLLGGKAGVISYGFARWSPGLAFGAAVVFSVAALLLLILRAPQSARAQPHAVLALAGNTAYAVALLSYVDNRSATYLLPYVALPLLLAAALWLHLLLELPDQRWRALRRRGLTFAAAVALLLVSAAWPSLRHNFSETALAHAYPGGGLGAAIGRLWHPPPIDPRAPEGERLLDRYVPGERVIVLLPTAPDLGVEIMMRSQRANLLYIADPVDDSLVVASWIPRLRSGLAHLHSGQRLLTDDAGLALAGELRAHPSIDPVATPLAGGYPETEWLLREIDRRWRIVPVSRGSGGLIVAELTSRQPPRQHR